MPRLPFAVILVAAALSPVHAQRPASLDLSTGRIVNRALTPIVDGGRRAIRLNEGPGQGLVWMSGADFSVGTIEVEVRGKDVFQRSFVGIAFHGADDKRYEVVYLRPFNFRTNDAVRRAYAIQYAAHPDFTWPKLRAERPGQFERGLPNPPDPNGWVRLRLELTADRVRAFVGDDGSAVLDVPQLGTLDKGRVGVWVGADSGGDFANFRIDSRR